MSNFDTWLTTEPSWRTGNGWWEVEQENLTHERDGAMCVAEISCDDCGKLVGWDDTGFTGFMTDASDTHNKCFTCYEKWEGSGE
jgi:hypothetical protein